MREVGRFTICFMRADKGAENENPTCMKGEKQQTSTSDVELSVSVKDLVQNFENMHTQTHAETVRVETWVKLLMLQLEF